jgi:predicted ATP-dependent endonuclease of OLD family
MKLVKIYFDAYKSLLNRELDIKYDCTGFVGTNESGKSNILSAINTLNGLDNLSALDTPKMAKSKNPTLRFHFALNETEALAIKNIILEWIKANTFANETDLSIQNVIVCLTISFNKSSSKEERYFSIVSPICPNKPLLILRHYKINEQYKIAKKSEFYPLQNAIIVTKDDIAINDFSDIFSEIDQISSQIEILESGIISLQKYITDNSLSSEDDSKKSEYEEIKSNIDSLVKKLDIQVELKTKTESRINDFNLPKLIADTKKNLTKYEKLIYENEAALSTLQRTFDDLKNNPSPTDAQTLELPDLEQGIRDRMMELENHKIALEENKKLHEILNEPLENKYTSEISELNIYLDNLIQKHLLSYLPKVVFWKYSEKYLLASETRFSDLLDKTSFNDISRPLLNVFRIGLNIKTLEDLKIKIKEIQDDSNERSRLQKSLNKKINKFISRIWQDYDQDINITLEKEQIRIEIFDPEHEDASYYNMEERSQGCQTFLSFLMTVGAETEHGVIRETILLLDEPETHLHPSGVRFMLQELIKISEKGNLVLYATHSIFLIDRSNLDRHIILKKEKEQTIIKPSNVGRIGYFMQEEVLYSTLDLDLGKDLTCSKNLNFVFEGDGDALLFEHFYDKIIPDKEKPNPIKDTAFHQGGKCSDIQKYFTKRSIPLSSKWVFILDNDVPAKQLKKYLEAKYKDYLNNDVFIFPYHFDGLKSKAEFEDMLPQSLLINVYLQTASKLGVVFEEPDLKKQITGLKEFSIYNEKIIGWIGNKDTKDSFKGLLKEVLNNTIRHYTKENQDVQEFKTSFQLYYEWAAQIILMIKSKD